MQFHPSKDILGTKSELLKGKRIVLCITGSVAAVQCPEIARALMRHGAEVFAVMSPAAQKIIHPHLMEWATGNAVITELTGKIEHIALVGAREKKADLVLVAPATANTISKIACGIDDTAVTSVASTAFGSKTPLIIVPAMHESMYVHPILIENIKRLKALGVEFVGPRIEEGKAKIAETREIVDVAIRKLTVKRDFSGLKVLVTAGPTVEHIDPVRVISNKSSGKMGVAIVEEALSRGAEVTLVYGLGTASPPCGVKVLRVETTEEMYEAVVSELKARKYDLVVAAAAAADWMPVKAFSRKVSTHRIRSFSLKLKPTLKIVDAVKKVNPKTFLVAFRAEYNLPEKELIESAYDRLKRAEADLIVVNDVGKEGVGFGTDTNEVFMVDTDKKVVHVPLAPKREIAKKILDVAIGKMKPNSLIVSE
ncbi:MAG: bifunctional phosphopantothenoylcysteine decarboxylase/phosphopantothenate--cysteine ligase CoaBC [Candidatus Bathyarchaeota archaeon]|nr:bifunctional phosphopantothenoylcysteine decarboxylase/phosphopantothenate--cysteine ligase CoaBC [Candidatus Bathyarchaeota archaeon]